MRDSSRDGNLNHSPSEAGATPAPGSDAATTPQFIALHDGDIASGVLDTSKGEVLPFWIEQKKDGAKWAERIAAALNAIGKEYR